MRSIFALDAALALAGVHVASPNFDAPTQARKPGLMQERLRGPAPNDFGPVADSTPESKRAKRRRRAKRGQHD